MPISYIEWQYAAENIINWECVGQHGCTRIEEVFLTGPGGLVPYIRAHHDNGYADFPKHNLVAIKYGEDA